MPAAWRELLRPWKLISFALGMTWLFWGALYLNILDWDLGVSVLMGGFTYLTAPFALRVLARREWWRWPEALFWTWFTVDGVYVVYFTSIQHPMLRAEQWPTSLCLYGLCGLIWMHEGPLSTLLTRHPRQ